MTELETRYVQDHEGEARVTPVEHGFRLRLSGDVEAKLDDLYEAGCSDATFGSVDGRWHADFDREAETFEVAVASAVADVGSVGGVAVEGVVPDGQG